MQKTGKKSEIRASPKVMKTNKEITSKNVLSLIKKPSTLTPVNSRQPSNVSRDTSKQRNVSTNLPRPANNFSATRSSKLNIVDDKLQQGVRKLGKVPSYIRGKRPVSAVGKLKATESTAIIKLNKVVENIAATKKIPNNVAKQYGSHAQSKAVLDGVAKMESLMEPNSPPTENAINLENVSTETLIPPPCEGYSSGASSKLGKKELELSEVCERMKQLDETCSRLETDCKQKLDQISELKATVAVKMDMIKEREEDIEKLTQTVENLRLTSASRDSIFRDMEHSMDGLRRDLAQKCHNLLKCEGKVWTLNVRIEDLEAKLVHTGRVLEEKETQLIESRKKETKKDSMIDEQSKEIDPCRQHSRNLTQQVNLLTQEIADKDLLIATLKKDVLKNVAQMKLEAMNVKQSDDDILLQVRSKLLKNIENSKEAFKSQCDEILSCGGDGETGVSNRTRTLIDNQRQRGKEAQIISEIERNNKKCRNVRNKLLKMVKQLKKENQQIRDVIINNSGLDNFPAHHENPTKDDRYLKDLLMNQICRLFPEEPVLQKLGIAQGNVEEKMLN